jgi:hypothetical protein
MADSVDISWCVLVLGTHMGNPIDAIVMLVVNGQEKMQKVDCSILC